MLLLLQQRANVKGIAAAAAAAAAIVLDIKTQGKSERANDERERKTRDYAQHTDDLPFFLRKQNHDVSNSKERDREREIVLTTNIHENEK